MKTPFFVLLVSLLSFGAFAQEQALDDASEFKMKFRQAHINEINTTVNTLQVSINKLSLLPVNEKQKILTENLKQLNIVRCENNGNFIRLCTFKSKDTDSLGADETVYNTQIYMRSNADFVNWQAAGQQTIEANCKFMTNKFYDSVDNIANQLVSLIKIDANNPSAIKQGIAPVLENNIVMQPYFTFNLEQDRQVIMYNCLTNSWSKPVTYPKTENILDGDCRLPEYANALGIENICSTH